MRPGSLITVEFGVTVLMFASVVCLGTPASQLPVKNQSEENCPVQLVWACVETVDAAKSAIVASNLDETNLQPARARDVAPRRGPVDDSRRGSHPISAPNQSAMPIIKNWAATAPDVTRRGGARNSEDKLSLQISKVTIVTLEGCI